MANTTYNIDIQVQSKSLGQLEDELAQINQELREVEVGSKAFKELSKRSQEVTKNLDKVNSSIKGFTAEEKFMAANGAVKVLGGSLAGVVGTLGMFGIESEVFGEFEKKAASAISVAIGFKDVSEGLNEVRKSLKGVTAAQLKSNAAALANPYVLLAAAVATLVAGLGYLILKETDLQKAAKDANKELEEQKKTFDGTTESMVKLQLAEANVRDTKIAQIKEYIKSAWVSENIRKRKLEEIALLEKESQMYKDSAKGIQDITYNLSKESNERAMKIEDLKDEIALYGDESTASGLIYKKIQLLKLQLQDTQDLKSYRDLKRQILLLEKELAKVLPYDNRAEVIPLETTSRGVKLLGDANAELIKMNKNIKPINRTLTGFADVLKEEYDKLAQLNEDVTNITSTIGSLAGAQEELREAEFERTMARYQRERDMIIGNSRLTQEEKDKQLAAIEKKENEAQIRRIKQQRDLFTLQQTLQLTLLTLDAYTTAKSIYLSSVKSAAEAQMSIGKFVETLGPFGIAAYGASIIGILATIRSARKKASSEISSISGGAAGGGGSIGGASIPSQPTNAPQQPVQLPCIRTYVLSGDVTSSQEADAKIARRRSLS